MSLTGAERIPCVCGAPVEVVLAESINAPRHPHLRRMIMERRLHRFECGACGRTLIFEKSLSYVDFDRRQLIQVAPRGDLFRADELVQLTRDLYARVFAVGPEPVQGLQSEFFVRLCFGYEELREKLVAFDQGINDLVLEMVKAELLAAEASLRDSGVLTLYLDSVTSDGTMELRVERPPPLVGSAGVPSGGPDAPSPQSVPQTLSVQRALYDYLAERYPEVLERKPRLASGPHVSLLRLMDWPAPVEAPPAPVRRGLL